MQQAGAIAAGAMQQREPRRATGQRAAAECTLDGRMQPMETLTLDPLVGERADRDYPTVVSLVQRRSPCQLQAGGRSVSPMFMCSLQPLESLEMTRGLEN